MIVSKLIDKLILFDATGWQLNKLSQFERNIARAKRYQLLLQIARIMQEEHHKVYFDLLNLDHEVRDDMNQDNLPQFIVNDTIETGEYTIEGIALYTQTPPDVIRDIASGLLRRPSYAIMEKLLEINFSVRKPIYTKVFEKLCQ